MTWTDEMNFDSAMTYIQWSKDEIERLEEELQKAQDDLEEQRNRNGELIAEIEELKENWNLKQQ